jgi:tripartite-type tricarboxylate transporter receptor subunit TctC
MTLSRRHFVLASGAMALGPVSRPAWSQPQPYPTRLIKIVVPFPAGGPTDLMGRLAAQQLSALLKQSAIVENLPGAGGTIGSRSVARAAPDGYTLLLGGTNSNAITPAVYKELDYDPVADFAPVAAIAVDSSALIVEPAVPAKTVQELVDYLKRNPGKVACGASVGIAPHALVAYFMKRSATDMIFVPYKGGAPLITDLLSGQVQMTFGAKSAYLPHIQAGKMRALAVTSEARWPELADVPTMREAGMADFPSYQWFDLMAPIKTPVEIVDKLNATINNGLKSAEFRSSLAKLGVELKIRTPRELEQILRAETQQWGSIVQTTGIKID